MTKTFEGSGLDEKILKAINDLGFETPTEIQSNTIPYLLSSQKDLIALAQTGTGKTAAFGLPIIHLTNTETKHIQSLVLCPTRELCIQIAKDFDTYTKYVQNFKTVAVYGGASIETQIKAIKKGAHAIVGTPGRVNDLLKRKVLDFSKIRWLILDEADEMLNMGFKDELDTILEKTKKDKQTLLFSATMPKEVLKIAKNYMHDPEQINVSNKNISVENINHICYQVSARNKYLALKRVADLHPNIYGIVFCRTRSETKEIAEKLIHDGYNADALHGDLSQAQRDHVMNRFRLKNIQLLVATDVAARGLDVNNLTHIINLGLPDDTEIYIHRSGRTGRAGKSGTTISIIHSREISKIKAIEKMLDKNIEWKKVPQGHEICEKQLFNLIDKVENIKVDEKQIEPYLDVIFKKLDWLNREDLIKHFVSVEFNRFLKYYKDAEDLNTQDRGANIRDRGDRIERRDRKDRNNNRNDRRDDTRRERNSPNLSRFFINLGSNQKLIARDIINLVNETFPGKNVEIGKIDIMKKFAFFELDKKYSQQIIKASSNIKFKGLSVSIEQAKPKTDNKKSEKR